MSRLFVVTILDPAPGELDQRLEAAHRLVDNCLGNVGRSESEVAASLNREVVSNHSTICLGLLSVILSEPERSAAVFSHLQYAAMDGLASVVVELQLLVVEQWHRLKEMIQQQLLWLVKQMVVAGTTGVEKVVWQLLRRTGGGGLRAAWLTEQLLSIVEEHFGWLVRQHQLVAALAFTLLRLVEDHSPLQQAVSWGRSDGRQRRENLIEREARMAARLIREQSASVQVIGRELVRALQHVARLPVIDELWQELLLWPNNFIPSLLSSPTPRHFLNLRVSPEMERKLLFLTQQVQFGKQDKYEAWFQRHHLATPESQGLRPDIVRYIVGAIHPSNEMLRSGTTPRWAVVGSFLTSCTGQVVSAFTKLAIFYDWISFNPEKDNVMSLEPAALLMQNSVKSHPQILPTMLDFLLRFGPAFLPGDEATVTMSINAAWRLLLAKKVLPGLGLFQGRNLTPELRSRALEAFEVFEREQEDEQQARTSIRRSRDPRRRSQAQASYSPSAAFSDSEDEVEEVSSEIRDTSTLLSCSKDIAPVLKLCDQLAASKKVEVQAKLVAQIVSSLPDTISQSQALLLAESLSRGLQAHFSGCDGVESNLPTAAVFELFPGCESAASPSLLALLTSLAALEPRLGSHFIHFLVESENIDKETKGVLYNKFCKARDLKCRAGLLIDLRPCQNGDVALLVHLVPSLFNLMPAASVGNVDLLYLLVSSIDGCQLLGLVQKVVSQCLVLLKADSCLPVLKASLSWETFEQVAFWQLYHAHDLPVNTLFDLIPHLEYRLHAEAITSVLLILKRKKPTVEILGHLFKRLPEKEDPVLPSLSLFWLRYSNTFPEVFATFLTRQEHLESKQERELLLKHTNLLLPSCHSIFCSASVQKGYKRLSVACSDEEKSRHADLFQAVFSFGKKTENGGERSRKRSVADIS